MTTARIGTGTPQVRKTIAHDKGGLENVFQTETSVYGTGCLFTITGYILASLGSDVDAQSEGDNLNPPLLMKSFVGA